MIALVTAWSDALVSSQGDAGAVVLASRDGWLNRALAHTEGVEAAAGETDVFIASYDPAGNHRWSKGFGSTSYEYGYGVATDGGGNVYITGYYYNSVNFGGGALTSNGSGDIFLASFTSGGTHRWSKGFGSTSSDYGYDVTTDTSASIASNSKGASHSGRRRGSP